MNKNEKKGYHSLERPFDKTVSKGRKSFL